MGGSSYKTINIKQRDISGSIQFIKAPLSPESEYAISAIRYVAYAISSAVKALDDFSNKNNLENAYNLYVNLMSQYVETANLLKTQSLPPVNTLNKTSFLEIIDTFQSPNILTETPTRALTKVSTIENGLAKTIAERNRDGDRDRDRNRNREQNLATRMEIIKQGAENASEIQNEQNAGLGNANFSRSIVISNPIIPAPFLLEETPTLPVNYGFSRELVMRGRTV